MPLAPNPAENLADAYRICDVKPLSGKEDLERYYVPTSKMRKEDAMKRISKLLEIQGAGQQTTILFTGHRGNGKSTALHRLEQKWQEFYHVIYMEVDEETDINDVAFTDIYLLVLKYVEFSLRDAGINVDQKIIKNIEQWFAQVTQETVESVESSVSVTGEVSLGKNAPFLAKLMVKLLAQIKGASQKKKTIRQTLEQDFSRLKADVNLFLDDSLKRLQEQDPSCKGILLIFDNLDRCPPQVTDKLFFDYAPQLQELRCSVIYTVPISTLYSQRGISNSFTKRYIVPMLGVYDYQEQQLELNYQAENVQKITEIIRRRVNVEKVFADEADLTRLVEMSGGHVRHLMQMTQEACLTALGRDHEQIEADDVTYAINQLQFDFERQIPDEHYATIARAQLNKEVANNPIGQMTLFNVSVLEYNGSQRWNYPHPTVRKISKFQDALVACQGDGEN